jgi:hypothetical protein
MINLHFPKYKLFNIWPFGRIGICFDPRGESLRYPGGLEFHTNLSASLFHKGKYEGTRDLGSGLVTNIGATALANEAFLLAGVSAAPVHILKLSNQHFSGIGVTAAAALDFKIGTISTQGGQTAVAGTQSWTNTMAVPKYQTVATIAYTGGEAVTEWGLFSGTALTSTPGGGTLSGTTTATTWTVASGLTASSTTVQGLQQTIIVPGTTTVLGHNQSNTTTVGTLANNGTTGWFTQAAMTNGSTPGNTETYVIRPIMWDHKVFSAINVVNGDSIQFTYQLTVSSGG